MLKTTTYQRKNNGHIRNIDIEVNPEQSSQINTDYSLPQYAKVNLALVTTLLGTMFLGTATALSSLEKSNLGSDTTDTGFDNSHSLINPQETITFADKSLLAPSKHAKRAFGGEFQVNTYTTGNQGSPSITCLSTGDFVVVWTSIGQDGVLPTDLGGIYGQRFNSSGFPQEGEFQINTYTTDDQGSPSITRLSTGDFVVVWMSGAWSGGVGQDGDGFGIYGQRFSGTGVPQGGEFQVNTYTTLDQGYPSVASLTTGDFVVVWMSYGQDGDIDGIYGQRFSSVCVPQGSEFQINTYTTLDQDFPSVASLTTGDFVVVWKSDGQDGDGFGIYGQRFSGTGVPQGGEFQVNTYTTGIQGGPSVVSLTTDDFVVVWSSDGQDGDGYGVYGQRFSGTGVPQGSEFQINTYTTSAQEAYSVAALSTGDFVVGWSSGDWSGVGQDGDRFGIYGQRFSDTGVPQGGEFQINTYTISNQKYPSVAALSTGDFVVVWTDLADQDGDAYGIYCRIYFSDTVTSMPTATPTIATPSTPTLTATSSVTQTPSTSTPTVSSAPSKSSSYLLMAAGGLACLAGEALNWKSAKKEAEINAEVESPKTASFINARSKTLAKLASVDTAYPNFSKSTQSENANKTSEFSTSEAPRMSR